MSTLQIFLATNCVDFQIYHGVICLCMVPQNTDCDIPNFFFYRIAFLKFVSFNNLGGLFKYGCFSIPSYQCQSTYSMCSTTSTSI